MKMQIGIKTKKLLENENTYVDFAYRLLTNEMRVLEKKYAMNWRQFMKKFDEGKLGDDRELFHWYGLAVSALDWYDKKVELDKILRTS